MWKHLCCAPQHLCFASPDTCCGHLSVMPFSGSPHLLFHTELSLNPRRLCCCYYTPHTRTYSYTNLCQHCQSCTLLAAIQLSEQQHRTSIFLSPLQSLLTANNFFHTSCSNRSSAVLVVVSKTAPAITRSVAPVSASRPPQQLLEACFASSFRSSSSIPRSKFVSLWSTRRGGASSAAMAPHATASSGLEAFGKAKSGSGSPSKERGDCPFSQRIYIELEEKKLPYEATYIEEGENKPEWFMEKNPKGLMPVLRDGETWIQDSDKIAEHLEEKYPQVSLKTPPQYKHIGLNVFQAFTSYLKVKNPDDKSKDELLKELAALDEHLHAHGPYIAGEKPTDSDYALIPKLHHMRIALGYYYDFQIPAKFTALHKYIDLLESRPSFQNTNSPDEMIIEGWQKKFQLPGRMVQPTAAA